jgi:hypothetical protein
MSVSHDDSELKEPYMKKAFIVSLSVVLTLMGVAYIAAPATYLGMLGVALSDPSMMNVIRSFGGFYLGFAVFLILAGRREGGADLAVFAAVLAMAGFLAGRAIGFFADGMPVQSVLVSGIVELIFAVWGIVIMARGSFHGAAQ